MSCTVILILEEECQLIHEDTLNTTRYSVVIYTTTTGTLAGIVDPFKYCITRPHSRTYTNHVVSRPTTLRMHTNQRPTPLLGAICSFAGQRGSLQSCGRLVWYRAWYREGARHLWVGALTSGSCSQADPSPRADDHKISSHAY